MKTLYLIGGTMGVGKTTVSQQLKRSGEQRFLVRRLVLGRRPFQVTDETKDDGDGQHLLSAE